MIPNDVVKAYAQPLTFLEGDNINITATSESELGGLKLGDATGGLLQAVWNLSYVNETITVHAPDGTVVLNKVYPGLIKASFCFDQNMRLIIAYSTIKGLFLEWFNIVTGKVDILQLPYSRSFRLTLDDKRFETINLSDVILFYITKENKLAYRLQRDRYTKEYLTGDVEEGYSIGRVGMCSNLRLGVELIKVIIGANYLVTTENVPILTQTEQFILNSPTEV